MNYNDWHRNPEPPPPERNDEPRENYEPRGEPPELEVPDEADLPNLTDEQLAEVEELHRKYLENTQQLLDMHLRMLRKRFSKI